MHSTMKSMITICVSSSHQIEHQWFGSIYRYLGIYNKRQTWKFSDGLNTISLNIERTLTVIKDSWKVTSVKNCIFKIFRNSCKTPVDLHYPFWKQQQHPIIWRISVKGIHFRVGQFLVRGHRLLCQFRHTIGFSIWVAFEMLYKGVI